MMPGPGTKVLPGPGGAGQHVAAEACGARTGALAFGPAARAGGHLAGYAGLGAECRGQVRS